MPTRIRLALSTGLLLLVGGLTLAATHRSTGWWSVLASPTGEVLTGSAVLMSRWELYGLVVAAAGLALVSAVVGFVVGGRRRPPPDRAAPPSSSA